MRILPLALLLISTLCFGQSKKLLKVASDISTKQLKKNLYYLTTWNLAND